MSDGSVSIEKSSTESDDYSEQLTMGSQTFDDVVVVTNEFDLQNMGQALDSKSPSPPLATSPPELKENISVVDGDEKVHDRKSSFDTETRSRLPNIKTRFSSDDIKTQKNDILNDVQPVLNF